MYKCKRKYKSVKTECQNPADTQHFKDLSLKRTVKRLTVAVVYKILYCLTY